MGMLAHAHCVLVLKGHSIDVTPEVQFTHHEYFYSVCKNSCKMSSVALEGAFQSLKKITNDVIGVTSAWAWELNIFNRKNLLQTGDVWFD